MSEFVTLDGQGGLLAKGRWHSAGRPIVYSAGSRSLAILEVLANLERAKPPVSFQLLTIEIPDVLAAGAEEGTLVPDADDTRRWGDAWLGALGSAVAKVPSAIVPGEFNWLINPLHPDRAGIAIVEAVRYPWDLRLFR